MRRSTSRATASLPGSRVSGSRVTASSTSLGDAADHLGHQDHAKSPAGVVDHDHVVAGAAPVGVGDQLEELQRARRGVDGVRFVGQPLGRALGVQGVALVRAGHGDQEPRAGRPTTVDGCARRRRSRRSGRRPPRGPHARRRRSRRTAAWWRDAGSRDAGRGGRRGRAAVVGTTAGAGPAPAVRPGARRFPCAIRTPSFRGGVELRTPRSHAGRDEPDARARS